MSTTTKLKHSCRFCKNPRTDMYFRCPRCRTAYLMCAGVDRFSQQPCQNPVKPHIKWCFSCTTGPSQSFDAIGAKRNRFIHPNKVACPACRSEIRAADSLSCANCRPRLVSKHAPVQQNNIIVSREKAQQLIAPKVVPQSRPLETKTDNSGNVTSSASNDQTPMEESSPHSQGSTASNVTVTVPPQSQPRVAHSDGTLRSMPSVSIQFAQMNEFRKKSQLCDYALQIKEAMMPCHRVVLASAVPFFHRLFTANADAKPYRVKTDSVSAAVAELYLTFVYCGHYTLSLSTLGDVLLLVRELETDALQKQCEEFLDRCAVSPDNCLEMYSLYARLGSTIPRRCVETVRRHLLELTESAAFLALPVELLCGFLRDNAIQCRDEKDVLKCALRWLDHDSERMAHSGDVLSHVRLALMGRKDLRQLDHPAFQSPGTRLLLESAIEYASRSVLQCHMYSSMLRPRLASEWEETLVVPRLENQSLGYFVLIADWNDKQRSLIWKKVTTRFKVHIAADQLKVLHIGSAVLMYGASLRNFYVMRGLLDNDLQIMPGAPEPVLYPTCVASNGSVFFIGGTRALLRSSESPVDEQRSSVPLAGGGGGGAGGGVRRHLLPTPSESNGGVCRTSRIVQRLELASSAWSKMPNLPVSVKRCHAFSVRNKIYVCGGVGANGRAVRKMQTLDLESCTWSSVDLSWPEPFDGLVHGTCIDATVFLVTARYIVTLELTSMQVTAVKTLPSRVSLHITANEELTTSAFRSQLVVISGAKLWLFEPEKGCLRACRTPVSGHLTSAAATLMKKCQVEKWRSTLVLPADLPIATE